MNRLRPDQAAGLFLLHAVGDPARDPADRESRREQWGFEPETVEEEGGVELDVRLQPAARFVFFKKADGGALDAFGKIVEWISAEEPLGRGGQDVCSRIADLVDAMPEAHEPFASLDFSAEDFFSARRVADLEN